MAVGPRRELRHPFGPTGVAGARFAWGDEECPAGRLMVNRWQADFPCRNTGAEGWVGTSPVMTFPANGFGFYDVTGSVWSGRPITPRPGTRCPARRRSSLASARTCSPEYCLRCRPAARSPQAEDTATAHIGFRCACDA